MVRLWIERLALFLVTVGALNWGLVGLFEFDLVAEIVGEEFGTTNALSRIIYTAVGAAALVLLATRVADMNAPSVDTDRSDRPATAR